MVADRDPAWGFAVTDHAALLAAVLDRPADDTPRLVYADWLDDHAQAERAEFIRAQVAIARLLAVARRSRHAPRRARAALAEAQTLQLRERELFAAHGGVWFGPTARLTTPDDRERQAGVAWLVVNRGFAGEVVVSVDVFVERAAALFAEHQITAVRLTDWSPVEFGRKQWRYRWATDDGRVNPALQEFSPDTRYYSRGGAERALSALCVRWGREQAARAAAPG
jgi:uncharacterized protein (TIGR02996 family)